jgi:aspartate-semialdehyde dehydrogenase
MDPTVPLLIPEVNPTHLELIQEHQGAIVANPNCSVIGITLALKPLADRFGLKNVHIVTLQAVSGAGAGAKFLDIDDNVIPFIDGEEEKIEREPLKILSDPSLKITAQCNRVPVSDGHLACVSIQLKRPATKQQIIEAWRDFPPLDLPSAPIRPLHYFEQEMFPQPKHHRLIDKGMGVSLGRLRPCSVWDYKFVVLSHNTIRGAAGGALLCGELCVKMGVIPKVCI